MEGTTETVRIITLLLREKQIAQVTILQMDGSKTEVGPRIGGHAK